MVGWAAGSNRDPFGIKAVFGRAGGLVAGGYSWLARGLRDARWMVLRCGSDKAGTALLRRHALIAGISQTLPRRGGMFRWKRSRDALVGASLLPGKVLVEFGVTD